MLSQSDFLVKVKGQKKQVDKSKKELALAERHTVFTTSLVGTKWHINRVIDKSKKHKYI